MLDRILVGSAAFKHWMPDTPRKVHDLDYFCLTPETVTSKEFADPVRSEGFYHPSLKEYAWSGDVASLNELYTIKVSHIYWATNPAQWGKHYQDILTFQHTTNAQFIPELYELLYKVWEERFCLKKANLEQDPKDFFNNRVNRIYEHDSIHATVAYYDEPLFNRILRTGSQVAVDKNKFDALTHKEKLQLVREEVYATALERQVIPSEYKTPGTRAYRWALMKTVTSFSKGWFPLWIILNAKELERPSEDYVRTHLNNSHLLVRL